MQTIYAIHFVHVLEFGQHFSIQKKFEKMLFYARCNVVCEFNSIQSRVVLPRGL